MDLRHGAKASDYEPLEARSTAQQSAPADAAPTVAEIYANALALKKGDFDGLRFVVGQLIKSGLEGIDERQILEAMKRSVGVDIKSLRDEIKKLRRKWAASRHCHVAGD